MRILDAEGIPYAVREYPGGPAPAAEVAALLREPAERVFKTLVTVDAEHGCRVFCLPGNGELDLRKAAALSGVKRLEMLPLKELFPVTGYVRGGCSPIGMRKAFPTVLDRSALRWESILVSGGRVGLQVDVRPRDLGRLLSADFRDIQKEQERRKWEKS